MGYRRKIYHLTWAEGHSLHGLEVSLTGMSIERLVTVQEAARALMSDGPAGDLKAATETICAQVAKSLLSWNLEDHDGQPVPPTHEGIADQDVGLITQIVADWMGAIASVDSPLPPPSNGGGKPMPEVSIPMVPLSPSRAS